MDDATNASELPTATQRPGVTIAERYMNPELLAARAPTANYTPYAVCAIVATLLFVVALVILWMDYSELMPV